MKGIPITSQLWEPKGLNRKAPTCMFAQSFRGFPFWCEENMFVRQQYRTLKSWESYPHQRKNQIFFWGSFGGGRISFDSFGWFLWQIKESMPVRPRIAELPGNVPSLEDGKSKYQHIPIRSMYGIVTYMSPMGCTRQKNPKHGDLIRLVIVKTVPQGLVQLQDQRGRVSSWRVFFEEKQLKVKHLDTTFIFLGGGSL